MRHADCSYKVDSYVYRVLLDLLSRYCKRVYYDITRHKRRGFIARSGLAVAASGVDDGPTAPATDESPVDGRRSGENQYRTGRNNAARRRVRSLDVSPASSFWNGNKQPLLRSIITYLAPIPRSRRPFPPTVYVRSLFTVMNRLILKRY